MTNQTINSSRIRLNKTSPAFQEIYNSNPYCILGISADSTRKEALDAVEKLKKYVNLGILSSYHPNYAIKSLDKTPNYNIDHLQTCLSELDTLESRFLWVTDSAVLDNLFDPNYFKITQANFYDYNRFIGDIYHCMITDPLYEDNNTWTRLFKRVDVFLQLNDGALYRLLLINHIKKTETTKYHFRMVVNIFRETIVNLFERNISHQNIKSLNRLLQVLKDTKLSFKYRLIRKIADTTLSSVTNELEKLDSVIEMTEEDDDYCCSEVYSYEYIPEDLISQLSIFERKIGSSALLHIIKKLDGFEQYSQILVNKYKNTIKNAADILILCLQNKLAGKYYSFLYPYLDDEEVHEVIGHVHEDGYPNDEPFLEYLKFSDSDFDDEECFDESCIWVDLNSQIDFKWTLLSAYKGNAKAMWYIYLAYNEGYGVNQDYDKARWWLKESADAGNEKAAFALGQEYINSNDTFEQRVLAKKYWILSYIRNVKENKDTCPAKEALDQHFIIWKYERILELSNEEFKDDESLLLDLEKANIAYASVLLGQYYLDQFSSSDDYCDECFYLNEGEIHLNKVNNCGFTEVDTYLALIAKLREEYEYDEDEE